MALGDIHRRFAWQSWYFGTGLGLVARLGLPWHPPSFHAAGVALADIHRRFAWQAWYLSDWDGWQALHLAGTWRHLLWFSFAPTWKDVTGAEHFISLACCADGQSAPATFTTSVAYQLVHAVSV